MLKTPIVIDQWERGIAQDPFKGFEDVSSVDIYSSPGYLKSGYRFGEVALTGTATPNKIVWFAEDPRTVGNFYACTDKSTTGESYKIWKTTNYGTTWSDITSGTQSVGNGQCLVYHNGRIYYVAVNSTTGRMDYFDGSTWTIASATYNFTTTTAPDRIPAVVHPADGALYLGIENNVAKIDAANAFTASALDLPTTERIFSLAALGNKLYIGARTSINGNVPGKIYTWDRFSDSFDYPIIVPSGTPYSMISSGGLIYFMAGSDLTVYATNGSLITPVFKIPEHILPSKGTNNNYALYCQSMAIMGECLMLAIGSGTTSASTPAYGRIFSYNLRTGVLVGEPQENAVNDITNTREYFCLMPVGGVKPNRYLIGTNLNMLGLVILINDVDFIRESSYSSSDFNYLISQVYSLGSDIQPITLEQCSIELGAALSTGQGVKISYRLTKTGNWTELLDVSFTTYGAITSLDKKISLTITGTVQFLISIKSNSNSTASPLLHSIKLY